MSCVLILFSTTFSDSCHFFCTYSSNEVVNDLNDGRLGILLNLLHTCLTIKNGSKEEFSLIFKSSLVKSNNHIKISHSTNEKYETNEDCLVATQSLIE